MTTFHPGAALLLIGLVACREAADEASGRPGPSSPGDMEMLVAIDALTALGYAGDVETDGDERTGVLFHDPDRSSSGYGLYTVTEFSRADIIDGSGQLIHSWSHPEPQGGAPPSLRWSRSILLDNGDLLVVGTDEIDSERSDGPARTADDARYLMRLNWDGNLIWKHPMRAHHDVEITPSGNILTLTYVRRDVPNIHPNVPIRVDRLTMLDQDGMPIQSRSVLPAVLKHPEIFPITAKTPDTLGGEEWVDLFHANSCEWMQHEALEGVDPIYASDNVLVCFRHQHRIAIFNWTRKEVVWSWGKGLVWGPHDAQVMEDGNILLFDNGLGKGRSRVLLLDPLEKEIVWQWHADPPGDFYTESRGSVQRLPNGNFLLTESDNGRVIEITVGGEIVWEFLCPYSPRPGHRAGIARMHRHEPALIERLLAEHQR
ncbi:MAG: hypothetical protein ACI8QZ_004370 [Chlamydiales bacterium]|jgi:hypothetical protein